MGEVCAIPATTPPAASAARSTRAGRSRASNFLAVNSATFLSVGSVAAVLRLRLTFVTKPSSAFTCLRTVSSVAVVVRLPGQSHEA